MDTREKKPLPDERVDYFEERGLGPWIKRNRWLLARLFTVVVFSFAASTVATNFSYSQEFRPTVLSVDQLNSGRLPAGTKLGDYVQVSGTPDVGAIKPTTIGRPESRIGVVSRYETAYLYYRLDETGDNLLIQSTQGL
ncbi:MAG TPA: hypothetical protein VFY59_07125, partial [Rubrobacter sp.]|nr:hypothetical protein [Rubrobacter sp.]